MGKISIKQLPARLPAPHKMFTLINSQNVGLSDKNTDVPTEQRTAEYVSETYHSCGRTESIKKQDGSSQNFATLDTVNFV